MRKIRTKQESTNGAETLILFCGVWFSNIIQQILRSGTLGVSMLVFAVAGLMPAVIAIRNIEKAIYYRKLHRQAMNRPPKKGRIISYERQMQRKMNAKGRTYDEYEYTLIIEVYDDMSYAPIQIRSDVYSWPVYECWLRRRWMSIPMIRGGTIRLMVFSIKSTEVMRGFFRKMPGKKAWRETFQESLSFWEILFWSAY